MSEETPGAAARKPRKLRAPLAFGRHDESAQGGDGAVAQAVAGGSERIVLMGRLGEKSRKLFQAEGVLQGLYDSSTDAQERRELDLQIDECFNERRLCNTRFDAIANNQPFNNPGPQADQDLLNAIDAVDTAFRNTAAVAALLGAVHGLVKAFPASST
jgi:hypothetical protein